MPASPDIDLASVERRAKEHIRAFTGSDEFKVEIKPIAFGLKAVDITFITPEEKGSTEPLEQEIAAMDGVNSAEVTDVRRAVG